ncbi:hypothetical protein [Muriicola sp. Z0-33]|uniref:hypothetical protein n=1 Tax=Muriicola sp. Z0-33 TaxID=2816957 RepID=UPI002238518C|nr:hypothetical protein [Muriicola sp. Z0-33]
MIFWSSCRKDFEYGFSTGRLEFSKDTVFLDTVFTNIGSSTYTLKVYNRSRDDILIPTIALAQGEASSYRLNVDGIPGKSFEDIPILAQDSIFIFVETTYDIAPTNQNEFLYTDLLQFDSGSNLQQVPIVTLIKDAVFLYPSVLADGSKETLFLGLDEEGNEIRIEGFILQDNQLNFNNEKPYVIYGYAAVAENKILTIEAGTRVHFHKDSGMLIGQGGTLQVNGSLSTNPEIMENEVIFEGDRLETALSEVPGQWGTIWLSQGSLNNVIDHLTVKNATLGMLVEGLSVSAIPTLTIKNSQIHNSATINIWARQSEIQAENVILGNAGNTSLKCSLGGEYSFIHTTIANYWSNGFRSGTALELSNFETDGNNEIQTGDLIAANFTNCIIDGNISRELSLNTMEGATFNFTFKNSMLKFRDLNNQFADNPLYDFTNPDYYNTLILNEDTNFLDTANSDFRIGSSSFAIDIADTDAAALVPLDIFGTDRTETPDIGAIEFLVQ